ncbi:MAG: hypothetical protein RLZZ126_1315 [Pseudomonadota bacterium]|jgi:cholesterol transport system auxiliary component
MKNTINTVANYLHPYSGIFLFFSSIALLTGCALPDKPLRPQTFDLGPALVAPAPAAAAGSGVLVLPDIDAPGALDSSAMAYRLAYANVQVLSPYAQARWSMPPAQLLHQRLRQRLGASRAVLSGVDAAPTAQVLRIELDEFSQVFDSAASSQGHIRVRATLLQRQGGAESFVAQRSFATQQPAPTPDAAGGAAALQRAVDDVAGQLDDWLKARR